MHVFKKVHVQGGGHSYKDSTGEAHMFLIPNRDVRYSYKDDTGEANMFLIQSREVRHSYKDGAGACGPHVFNTEPGFVP